MEMKIKHPLGAPGYCSHFLNASRGPVLHRAPPAGGVGRRKPWMCGRRTHPGESTTSPASRLPPQSHRMSPYLCPAATPPAATGGCGRGSHPRSQLLGAARAGLHSLAWKTAQHTHLGKGGHHCRARGHTWGPSCSGPLEAEKAMEIKPGALLCGRARSWSSITPGRSRRRFGCFPIPTYEKAVHCSFR